MPSSHSPLPFQLAACLIAGISPLSAQETAPRLLKNIHQSPNGEGSEPSNLRSFGDQIIFDTFPGRELWRSDGTAAGTVRMTNPVAEIRTWDPRLWIKLGNKWLFTSPRIFESGPRLWVTDGTGPGTLELSYNPHLHSFPAEPGNFTVCGDFVYFTVNVFSSPGQLWRSDGTPDGTRQVYLENIRTSGPIGDLRAAGDRLYFTINKGGLYSTTASAEGGITILDKGLTDEVVVSGDQVYLTYRLVPSLPYRLYKSGGTTETTAPVEGPESELSSDRPENLTIWNGSLYFTAGDSEGDRELWKHDAAPPRRRW